MTFDSSKFLWHNCPIKAMVVFESEVIMYDTEKTVRFADVQEVKDFVSVAEKCDFDIDVYYNRAVIDAKSIMGMLAIGLHKNMTICYGGINAAFEKFVDKFVVA